MKTKILQIALIAYAGVLAVVAVAILMPVIKAVVNFLISII